ncbi:MAG: hypothetical protein L0Y71_14525 [Gemmataceae bacterium]|nr:hypothetical protein [Gemmataceae bacterium]
MSSPNLPAGTTAGTTSDAPPPPNPGDAAVTGGAPGFDSAIDDLTETYLDLVDRHGLDSGEAKGFRDKHAHIPEIQDWLVADQQLRDAARAARLRLWFVRAAWAASLLIVVGIVGLTIFRGNELAATFWGWQDPDVFRADLGAAEYYKKSIAAPARQWYDRRPEDRRALARRLTEFRYGCTVLLLAEHKPLIAGEREWLLEKCREWAARCEDLLHEIEDTATDAMAVRAKADSLMDLLVLQVEARAQKPQTSAAGNDACSIHASGNHRFGDDTRIRHARGGCVAVYSGCRSGSTGF